MFALNFISIELENPFGLDANDLPLAHFQPPGSLIGKVNQEFFLVVVSTNGTCSVKVGCKLRKVTPAENKTNVDNLRVRRSGCFVSGPLIILIL